jgi:hypothetical protein
VTVVGGKSGLGATTGDGFGPRVGATVWADALDRIASPRIAAKKAAALRMFLSPFQRVAQSSQIALSCQHVSDEVIMSLIGKMSNALGEQVH